MSHKESIAQVVFSEYSRQMPNNPRMALAKTKTRLELTYEISGRNLIYDSERNSVKFDEDESGIFVDDESDLDTWESTFRR